MSKSELLRLSVQRGEPRPDTTKEQLRILELTARVFELEAAIKKTLDDNGYLADGDNCTLIELKKVIGHG